MAWRATLSTSAAWLLALLATPALAQTVTGSMVPNRTSGGAPLAVFFDATGTTCSGCGDAFHDLHYQWDFGDPNSGSWAVTAKSKNQAFGPTAAHVYEAAGTYTVKLTIQLANGQTQTKTSSITVASADATWPGTKTTCFSTGASFVGCPSGAKQVTATTLTAAACPAGQRCLFKRGETFRGGKLALGGSGPGLVGAFGSGNKPRLAQTSEAYALTFSSNTNDWRVMDVELEGYPGDVRLLGIERASRNVLILRTQNVPGSFMRGVLMEGSTLDYYGDGLHDGAFLVENTWRNFAGNIVFISAARMAILGNVLDDAIDGGHIIRVAHGEKAVISNNELSGQDEAKQVLTLRSANQNGTCSSACGRPSRDIVVSDNIIRSRDDIAMELTAPNAADQVARGVNYIVERNFFTKDTKNLPDAGVQLALDISSTAGVTVRNNLVVMDGWQLARGIESGGSNVRMVNNTCFTPTTMNIAQCIRFKTPGVLAINNVLYAPGATTKNLSLGTVTTASGNIVSQANPFTSANGSAPANFVPKDGSELTDRGTKTLNPVDFACRTRPSGGALDVGAFERLGSGPVVNAPPAAPTLLSVDVLN